jgi:hypothetical protein
VGLERGPLSLVRIIEELLEWKSSGPGNPLRWPRDTLHPQKLALTSPTSSGRSVGIFACGLKATEFVLFVCIGFFVTCIEAISDHFYFHYNRKPFFRTEY